MVHNGIEYGDMQLICESYHLMKDVLGLNQDEMAQVSCFAMFLAADDHMARYLVLSYCKMGFYLRDFNFC